jgi:hypothetical protein
MLLLGVGGYEFKADKIIAQLIQISCRLVAREVGRMNGLGAGSEKVSDLGLRQVE